MKKRMNHTKLLQVQAYEHIKEMVLSGQLQQDEIYSETKIAKMLGISRTPVRDAIQYLSQEKYIDIIPNKGFRLHKMEMKDFNDTIQIRSAIEGYCAWQLAQEYQAPQAQQTFQQLQECLERQQAAMERDDVEAYFEADIQFHNLLVDHSQNEELMQMYGSYMYRMRNLARHSLGHPGRMPAALEEHTAMYQNMKQGNWRGAYESTLFHMESPRNISVEE